MPSKSRRSRRNFPRTREFAANPNVAAPVERDIDAPAETIVRAPRPTRAGAQAEVVPVYPYVLRELRWIALVTVLIAAILVVLYLVFA